MRDMIDLCKAARAAMRTQLASNGFDPDAAEVDWDSLGLIIGRRPIGRERLPSRMDSGGVRIQAKIPPNASVTRMTSTIRRFVTIMAALRDRQAAIAPYVLEDGTEPAWSVLASRCLLHVLHAGGHDDAKILRMYRTADGHHTADELGFTVGWKCRETNGSPHAVRVSRLALGGGVLRADHVDIDAPSGLVYRGGRPERIVMRSRPLPGVIAAAISGSPIGDVVDHPVLVGCRARVSGVGSGRGASYDELVLNLARDLIPMADAPPGVERPWLRVLAAA